MTSTNHNAAATNGRAKDDLNFDDGYFFTTIADSPDADATNHHSSASTAGFTPRDFGYAHYHHHDEEDFEDEDEPHHRSSSGGTGAGASPLEYSDTSEDYYFDPKNGGSYSSTGSHPWKRLPGGGGGGEIASKSHFRFFNPTRNAKTQNFNAAQVVQYTDSFSDDEDLPGIRTLHAKSSGSNNSANAANKLLPTGSLSGEKHNNNGSGSNSNTGNNATAITSGNNSNRRHHKHTNSNRLLGQAANNSNSSSSNANHSKEGGPETPPTLPPAIVRKTAPVETPTKGALAKSNSSSNNNGNTANDNGNGAAGDTLDNAKSNSGGGGKDSKSRRNRHRKPNIHPTKGPGDWVTQLAYSFRSPSPPVTRHKHALFLNSKDNNNHHNSAFPPPGVRDADATFDEATPLVGPTTIGVPPNFPPHSSSSNHSTSSAGYPYGRTIAAVTASRNYVGMAAAFLRDYEAGRAPTLSKNLHEITDRHLRLYEYKFGGWLFNACVTLAASFFFISSMLEGFDQPTLHQHYLTSLNFLGLAVFALDIWFRNQLRGRNTHHTRTSRSERLVKPVILFSIVLGLENIARMAVTSGSMVLFSSVFKPLILFYVSTKARDALESLRRIMSIVTRVLLMELLLILMFAAVACRLFQEYASFADLGHAWLSLFELATTVVNPGIWMPMYQHSKFSAIFFIFFIITAVFYLHSLVLSVVFSTYVQAAAEIHERSSSDREDSIKLAFSALSLRNPRRNVVEIGLVRDTLRIIRPHYNAMKINALVEIVDPADQRVVDFGTFRTKIRQALNASIRTARSATPLATFVELIAVAVAVINFAYVIMVSSKFNAAWFDSIQERVGTFITLVAGFELLIRFNPLRIPDFTPLTRLNATFDGLALGAAILSSFGIILYATGLPLALEYILMGRAVDMIRIMRFFQIFRDVVRRSSDVMPALAGPIILVITTIHIFVYMGMALWGGSIQVGQHFGEITYLYDLNNFNSYTEGLVTMFQVLVVNDWFAIAEVFLFADRNSNPLLVYTFFVLGNLIGVSIMLNVLTAFFVETFVTKLDDSGQAESTTVQKDRDFNIMTSEKHGIRRVSSSLSPNRGTADNLIDRGADADSEGSSEDLYEFDIYEREGFDRIMETVSGSAHNHDFAQQMCNYLDIFESLAPGREKVGYLICDQRTLERFGNRRFQAKAGGFLTEQELNSVVSDMHSELLVLSARATFSNDRALIRTFPHRLDPVRVLEISASILRRHPAVSIFLARQLRSPGATSPPVIPE